MIFALLPLLYHVCITPSLKLSRYLLCGSHGSTAVVHQALPFATATGGASVCVRVYVMFSVDLGNRNEHIMSRKAAQGGGRHNAHFCGDLKNNRAEQLRHTPF